MRFLIIFTILSFLAACQQKPEEETADLIIEGGIIHTLNEAAPTAEAVAIRDGRIIYVGANEGADEWEGRKTKRIDLKGAALYPGFTDAHAHLLGIGQRELTLNLEGTASIADLVSKVEARLAGMAHGEVLYGRGWIETHWPEGRFPTRDDLDAVSPDNPVILRRADGHALVANTRALEGVGITAATETPFGGEILKDPRGTPTGVLVDNAMGLIEPLIDAPSEDDKRAAYIEGAKVYVSRGWTQIQSMSVNPANVPIMQGLLESGDMQLRVYNSIDGNNPAVRDLLASGPQYAADGLLTTRAIKLYMDGALGSRGAALLEPYSDAETSGLVVAKKEEVMPILTEALRAGIQVNTHAIGDRGNRLLLDWYEEAFNAVPAAERKIADPRWRDEHTQIVHADDIPRYKALGVIPSMQPSHAIGDLYFAPSRLGQDRLTGAYAWRTLIDEGNIIAAGSDAPVEVGDPRIEFYAAVARKSIDGFSNEDWHAEEAVTREEALKMLTLWPAYAAFQENDLGSIEVGKIADLSAFSKDLMTIPESEIMSAEAVLTVVNGKMAYQSPALTPEK